MYLLAVFPVRFPHPVTLAGMLEMGSTYLPLDHDWYRYINTSNTKYEDLQKELKLMLTQLADKACQYSHGDRYAARVGWGMLDLCIENVLDVSLCCPMM